MAMILELLPEVGVATLRLGMSADEAVGAARELAFAPSDPDYGDAPGQVPCEHGESRTEFTLGFTKGALTDIHVHRFRIEDADVTVVLDGLDVFRTPSDELLERLEERGCAVEQNDDGVDTLPDLKVILSNESSYEYPMDEEGDPIYFDYALVTSVDFRGPRGD
ncbi:hypothetical protein [Streptomyces sp. NBC_01142]|uniref:hypothetical protein n=1 Tax=Streptomyces sp. NBC_01142 TaxID=2975865 RepID=UPI00224D2381|nr:hypothetical protein [Streptomyces sp. NBC_01142]